MVNSTKNIIGYIHVCQKDGWKRSFDMIFNSLKNSGLYERTKEIRCGIVNDYGYIIQNKRFDDPKIKILFCKNSSEYERPTLYHMRINSDIDPDNTAYWYTHTKGIRHFGHGYENNIIDWINFLLYWNITKWKIAIEMLNYYDTYGCNAISKQHYSGNFWWTNIKHLRNLPVYIADYYTGPEDWICIKNDKMFNILSSGLQGEGHYNNLYPRDRYEIPENFDINAYRIINRDIHHLNYDELIPHYLKWGRFEGKNYKMPDGFDFDCYRNIHNMLDYKDADIVWHWFNHGQYEGRQYKY